MRARISDAQVVSRTRSCHRCIRVIYGGYQGYEGYRYPSLFGLEVRTPTFQDTDEEFAVVGGDLRRLNYTKTVFCPDPARRAHVISISNQDDAEGAEC